MKKMIYNGLGILSSLLGIGVPIYMALDSRFYSLAWFVDKENTDWYIEEILFGLPRFIGIEDFTYGILFNYLLFASLSIIYFFKRLRELDLFTEDGILGYFIVLLGIPVSIMFFLPVFWANILVFKLFEYLGKYFIDKGILIDIEEKK